MLLKQIESYIDSTSPNHPYDGLLEDPKFQPRFFKGIEGKPSGKELYRLHTIYLSNLTPKRDVALSGAVHFYTRDNFIEPAPKTWTPLSKYFEDAPLKPGNSATFWTDWSQLIVLLQADMKDLMEAHLKLGLPAAFSDLYILKIPEEKLERFQPKVPSELDGIDHRPFCLRKFRKDCVNGTTLDLSSDPFILGQTEFLLKDVRVSDVEFFKVSKETDDAGEGWKDREKQLGILLPKPKLFVNSYLVTKLLEFFNNYQPD